MLQSAEIVKQVNAARAGEMAAWNVLYQYYYPRLLSTALHICGNTPGVKDIVQDSFVTAFLKLSQLKDVNLFGAWIKKILLRKCYRENYKEGPELHLDWEESIEEAENYSRLHAAIANLPEILRTTLLLRYFSGRTSYQQIAEVLSIPVGTVRSRLNEAKSKLSANWLQVSVTCTKERDTWNQFYQETLLGLHHNAAERKIFLEHIGENATVTMPGGRKINKGRNFFEDRVADDQVCGSYLKPIEVISSGNLTIVEQAHFNSPEHPHHCPSYCMVILYRQHQKVERVQIHAKK